MTVEKALELAGIDSTKIVHNAKEEGKECVVFGTYLGEQIDVYDNSDTFVIGLGVGRKNYRVFKDSGKVEEFRIIVA
ncbi:MAG: hypothetical protein IJR93_09510 [Treponema sp.]|nr:hypothetical protein [Treponema sp.]